jgi:hypothetical protein
MDTTALLKEVRKEITRLEKIATLLGAKSSSGKGKKKRKLSKAAREKISAAQTARWAKVRAGKK